MAKLYHVQCKGNPEKTVLLDESGNWVTEDGSDVKIDRIGDGMYRISTDAFSFEAVVVKRAAESTRMMINGKLVDVHVETTNERLIKTLGLDKSRTKKLNDLKAPMPGKVVKVIAQEGQEVGKGDSLLVLEAMKMENLIKASAGATVGRIDVSEGQAVEKGQLLMKFN